jgi:hypothetical protein
LVDGVVVLEWTANRQLPDRGKGAGLKSMREKLTHLVPQGRLKVVQDCAAAHFQPSLRDWVFHNPTQD